jgi:hypothetical protein
MRAAVPNSPLESKISFQSLFIVSLQAKPLKRKRWLMRGKDLTPMPPQRKYSVILK